MSCDSKLSPFFISAFKPKIERGYSRLNDYLAFFYHQIVVEKMQEALFVLYGFNVFTKEERLLNHLFKYASKVAVSCSNKQKQDSDEILKILKSIEKDCGRYPSKGAIAFEFFKSESILHK